MKVRLPEGGARRGSAAPPPAKRAYLCPRCGSRRVNSDLNFMSTPRYLCADCGFRGAFLVTEADAPPKEETK